EHAAHAHRLVADLDAGELLVLGGEGLHEEVVEALDERALVDDRHRLDRGARAPGSYRGGRAADQSRGQEFTSSAHETSSATRRTGRGGSLLGQSGGIARAAHRVERS